MDGNALPNLCAKGAVRAQQIENAHEKGHFPIIRQGQNLHLQFIQGAGGRVFAPVETGHVHGAVGGDVPPSEACFHSCHPFAVSRRYSTPSAWPA